MIKEIKIKNYKSIFDTTLHLSPFTLLIGANGTGKSNFLQFLKAVSDVLNDRTSNLPKHINYNSSEQEFIFTDEKERILKLIDQKKDQHSEPLYFNFQIDNESDTMSLDELKENIRYKQHPLISKLRNVSIFSLDPENAGRQEDLVSNPFVLEDGSGVVQVLDALKTGDREDLFDKIEYTLSQFISEIEKLSFLPNKNVKHLQVREKFISAPIPVSQLSDGVKLALILITIIFQERPPSLICIEEIDRGLHPRLFGKIVELCFNMANRDNMPQIIATTHNPYLVDQFKDNEYAIVISEKKEGKTFYTSLKDRLVNLKPEEEPLGELWYSGYIGGIPHEGV
ncbi:chromosome segregation protein SMC [Candidatus Magnetomorum sp. HK-1]|nr:chromosome segregation protein SMC [Candidatus Magnetomorum sp. HK-1]